MTLPKRRNTLLFGAFRPHGQMWKLADTLRHGQWYHRHELLQTIATKDPAERLASLKIIGKKRFFSGQTHLWDIEEANGQVRMINIRPL